MRASTRSFAARLFWTAVSMLAFLSVMHAAFYLLPGDPVRALFGFRSPGPELVAELRAAFHLDDPYPVQLGRYLAGLVTGDLGPVYRLSPNGLSPSGATVSGLIWSSVPATLRMVGLAVVLQTLIGTGLSGLLSTATGRRARALKIAVSLLIAIPAFVLASWAEIGAPGLVDGLGLLAGAAFLAATPSGSIALIGYPLLREARGSAFARRAIASGMSARRVRWIHALRPTFGAMVTLGAAETGNLLTAAVLVEPIIGRPGLGSVLVTAINARQGPTILATVGMAFILAATMNLAADIVTMRLDPRINAL